MEECVAGMSAPMLSINILDFYNSSLSSSNSLDQFLELLPCFDNGSNLLRFVHQVRSYFHAAKHRLHAIKSFLLQNLSIVDLLASRARRDELARGRVS